ncbi:MAG: sugar transferase [candidate division WOR-3 bacterium]|nr:sugar transferase [candidate division WOR-3 bacterium]
MVNILIDAIIILGAIGFWSYIFGEYSNVLKPHFGFNLKTQSIFLFTILTICVIDIFAKNFNKSYYIWNVFVVLWLYMNFIAPFLRLSLQRYISESVILVTNDTSHDYLFYKHFKKLTYSEFGELLQNSSFDKLNKNHFVFIKEKKEELKTSSEIRQKGVFKITVIKTKNFINYFFETHIQFIQPAPMELAEYRIKRIIDYSLAIITLLLFLPIFMLISLCIKLESSGGVFYRHKRLGRYMHQFNLYKFRTMFIDADKKLNEILKTNPKLRKEFETTFKLRNDPRVTRVGKILRKFSLDELPQLINVLKGEISLVGPRPIVKEEVSYYQKFSLDLFMVLPGVSGLWQVSGRSDTSYNERVKLDTEYVRRWSLWGDLKILIKTLPSVISGRGAY